MSRGRCAVPLVAEASKGDARGINQGLTRLNPPDHPFRWQSSRVQDLSRGLQVDVLRSSFVIHASPSQKSTRRDFKQSFGPLKARAVQQRGMKAARHEPISLCFNRIEGEGFHQIECLIQSL